MGIHSPLRLPRDAADAAGHPIPLKTVRTKETVVRPADISCQAEVHMLPVRFEDIRSADILRLVQEKVSEHKKLEYKQRLSIGTGDEKAEFLADISSFANASGGDILFGISDERDQNGTPTGIPSEIMPLLVGNPASECARIEQLIETGIQPKIPFVQVKAVDIPEHGMVIVVRVGKSWVAPHMVTYANRSRFYRLTFDAARLALGASAARSLDFFEACRRKRNTIDYDQASVATDTEAAEITIEAGSFLELVEQWIETHHPKLAK